MSNGEKANPGKPKLALYWAASCGGCETGVLEIHEHIFEVIEAVEIVFWPCVMDIKYVDLEAMPDRSIDVCLFNGAIRHSENEDLARLLRRKSKLLLAYGSCAVSGGIPGLANFSNIDHILEGIHRGGRSNNNPKGILPQVVTRLPNDVTLTLPELHPRVRPLHHVVPVDFFMPGCPPTAKQTLRVLQAVVGGRLGPLGSTVGVGDRSVCDECPLEKQEKTVGRFRRPTEIIPDGVTCLLEQGVICAGPATRSGCEARCMAVNMPCRGCYGPAQGVDDPGAKMIAMLGSLVGEEKEEKLNELAGQVVDPGGTFYRFCLADSLLGRARR